MHAACVLEKQGDECIHLGEDTKLERAKKTVTFSYTGYAASMKLNRKYAPPSHF